MLLFLQIVQSGTDSGDDKCGKGTVLALNGGLHFRNDIAWETDGFIGSRRCFRNFEFGHSITPQCKCIAIIVK